MNKKRLTIVFLLLLIHISIPTLAVAVNEELATTPLSETDKAYFLENIKIVLLDEEPEPQKVQCFAISHDGMIALGHENNNSKTVTIYSKDGEFQYGYGFTTYGDFGLEWNAETLRVYFVRSDILVTLDRLAEITAIEKVLSTSENNTYIRNNFYAYRKTINGQVYQLRNDSKLQNIFASSYSQLTTMVNGDEIVLYQAPTGASTNMEIVTFCLILGIALIICLGMCMRVISRKKHV